MINLEELAFVFNELLGKDKYLVYLFTNAAPVDTQGRNVVSLNVLRVPFGYTNEELDVESLNCTLTFDLPCDKYGVVRDQALAKIEEKLLGRQVFNVVQPNGKIYIINTFFEMQPPGPPRLDGGIMQQIVVSGRALVQNAECKALVGNDVKISINGERLLKVSAAAATQVGADSNVKLSEDVTLAETYGFTRASSKSLEFLYTGKAIEDTFLQIAEGINFDLNKEYIYKAEYPTFTIETPFKLLSVDVTLGLGVYVQYKLTVQQIADATITKTGV
jgi:hypothetical protein